MKEDQRGFTLIELLVVIAIIGLLSSIIFAALTRARITAEDSRRRQNKDSVVTALNLYYNDYGHFPNSGNPADVYYRCLAPSGETCYAGVKDGDDLLITNLAPYLRTLPVNNAIPGTIAYNRLVYEYSPDDANGPGSVWLLWMQENPLDDSQCNGPSGIEDTVYWYCYQYIGF
ncbi:type II secretion system GspH family protein [Candidatus Parcubacteria bacterium]|nr:type II secretion system GspH family protein [Candidatus Parcubacteria bacterium]